MPSHIMLIFNDFKSHRDGVGADPTTRGVALVLNEQHSIRIPLAHAGWASSAGPIRYQLPFSQQPVMIHCWLSTNGSRLWVIAERAVRALNACRQEGTAVLKLRRTRRIWATGLLG